MIRIRLIPAEYGAAIIVRIEDEITTNIVIDGGMKTTFDKYLKKEIDALIQKGEKIDLLICSHIDNDHINGLIPVVSTYTNENIKDVWHNGFLQIVDIKFYSGANIHCSATDSSLLDKIIGQANIDEDKHEIGIGECICFDERAMANGMKINLFREGKAIQYIDGSSLKIGNAEIVILGPTNRELNALANKWTEYMVSQNYRFSVADKGRLMQTFEMILKGIQMAYVMEDCNISSTKDLKEYCTDLSEIDESVTNASSIAFILFYKNFSFLFLGDAVIDKNFIERLSSVVGDKFVFTGMQLPHHGSRYNINKDFIRRYTAEEYYVLTNSKRFHHPDISSLANIAIENGEHKTFIFNYPVEQEQIINNPLWMKNYKYETITGDGKSVVERQY